MARDITLSGPRGRVLCGEHRRWSTSSSALRDRRGAAMSSLYAIALLIALALGVYLVWALFRPEDFS